MLDCNSLHSGNRWHDNFVLYCCSRSHFLTGWGNDQPFHILKSQFWVNHRRDWFVLIFLYILIQQEEQNRGKPNWEHLNDELHVLITVEDTENRAKVKLQRAVDEIRKLLVPAVSQTLFHLSILPFSIFQCPVAALFWQLVWALLSIKDKLACHKIAFCHRIIQTKVPYVNLCGSRSRTTNEVFVALFFFLNSRLADWFRCCISLF